MGTCSSHQASKSEESQKCNLMQIASCMPSSLCIEQRTVSAFASPVASPTLANKSLTATEKYVSLGDEVHQSHPTEMTDVFISTEPPAAVLPECATNSQTNPFLGLSEKTEAATASAAAPCTELNTALNGGTSSVSEGHAPSKYILHRPRPPLTIFTEMDDEDNTGMMSLTQQSEYGKYVQTPVVAVLPFAARDSRMQTASMFQERYGGRVEDNLEVDSLNETEGVLDLIDAPPSMVTKSIKAGGRKSFFSFLNGSSDLKEKEEKTKDKKNKKQSKKNVPPLDSLQSPAMSREQIIRVGSNRLQRRVNRLNLLQHRVKDDGNCQFRAIAQQLLGSEEYHDIVRVHVVTYMMSVRERFDCYFEKKENADEYYRSLLKNGIWGDELTLRGASDSLFINIHVLSSEQRNFYITYRPSPDAPPPPAFLVDVATLNEQKRARCSEQSSPASNSAPGLGSAGSTAPRRGSCADKLQGSDTLLNGGGSVCPTEFCSAADTPPAARSPNGVAGRVLWQSAQSMRVDSTIEREQGPLDGSRVKEEVKECVDTAAQGSDEESGKGAVDANALQRRLQQKLTNSMILPAMDPKLDGLHDRAAIQTPLMAYHLSARGRALHARTVSQDIAKFWAVGAEMEKTTEAATHRVPVFQSSPHTSADAATPVLQTVSSLAFVTSTPTRRGADMTLFPQDVRQHGVQSEWPSCSPMKSVDHTQDKDKSLCLAFEPRTEPVDVFLSYLYPVHYNALSLSEDDGSSIQSSNNKNSSIQSSNNKNSSIQSSSNNNNKNKNSSNSNSNSTAHCSGSVGSPAGLCEQSPYEIPSRIQSLPFLDCVNAPFLKRIRDFPLGLVEKSVL